MAPKKQVSGRSVSQTLSHLVKSLQFYWYLGHVFSVASFTLSMVTGFFSPSRSLSYYRSTLIFELISYGIVVKQVRYKTKKVSLEQLLKDENVQYLLFAIILFTSSFVIGPITGALYSYVTFSFFHSISYFQAHVLESLPISINSQASINSKISFVTTNYNQQALLFASAGEVMILTNFLWSAPGLLLLIFRKPIYSVVKVLTFVAAVVFVKLRYNDSQYTKTVVQQFDFRIASLLANPMVPVQVSTFYNVTFKNFVLKYVGPIKVGAPVVTKKNQ